MLDVQELYSNIIESRNLNIILRLNELIDTNKYIDKNQNICYDKDYIIYEILCDSDFLKCLLEYNKDKNIFDIIGIDIQIKAIKSNIEKTNFEVCFDKENIMNYERFNMRNNLRIKEYLLKQLEIIKAV